MKMEFRLQKKKKTKLFAYHLFTDSYALKEESFSRGIHIKEAAQGVSFKCGKWEQKKGTVRRRGGNEGRGGKRVMREGRGSGEERKDFEQISFLC